MSARGLTIGTRASALALWQARRVAELIAGQPGAPAVELKHIRTEGDARTDIPLWQAGGRAFFTREIDRALVGGSVDVAVHSLKDLSTTLEPGVALIAVLEREDPRDALIAGDIRRLTDLPRGARVGTSSLRRRAFLARARADLRLEELRGNVPTRIERLREGRYDAIILALAGLKRLGLEGHVSAALDPGEFPPAVSQGAIAVCARADDAHAARWLAALDHAPTRLATCAERALLKRVEGGCQVPLGALAALRGAELEMTAAVCSLDGREYVSSHGAAPVPRDPGGALEAASALGERLAEELLGKGAGRIVAERRVLPRIEAP
jgi:hydroxymethylbilane synthase